MKKTLLLTGMFLTYATVFTTFSQRPFEKGDLISFTQAGVLAGNSENENNAPFIFNSSLNYVFCKNLSAGVGVGVEFFKEAHLPLTANLLYQLGDKKAIIPFAMLQAGYQIPLESRKYPNNLVYYVYSDVYPSSHITQEKLTARGGILLNPSVGVIFYTKSGLGVSLAAGYRYQQLNYKDSDDYELHIEYNRLSLSLGIIF
jgi:hypothetical protein